MLRAGYNSSEAAKELWIACKRDPFFWINTFVWTYNPKIIPRMTTRPMVTYPFQDRALWDMFNATMVQIDLRIEKSREMSATWNLIMVELWLAQFHRGISCRLASRNADLVDNTEDPDALFSKLDFIIEHQPPWIINENQFNRTYMHYYFYETESGIDGNTTTSDLARGGRATIIGFDEFGFVPDGYAMLRASRASTNCRIFNSTANGTGNAFYDLKKAKIKQVRLYWPDHPEKRKGLYRSEDGKLVIIDKEFKGEVVNSEGKKFQFPDNYPFRLDGELRSPFYDRECDRAAHPMEIAQELDIDYLGSDYQFFDAKVIDRIQMENVRDPVIRGELEFDYDTARPVSFVPFPDGRIKLWINLTPEGKFPEHIKAILGADVSAGTGASNSVSSGVDRETGEKFLEFATPDMFAEDFANYSVAITKWLNEAFLIWDASGPHGRIFSGRVMDLNYTHIYWKTALNRITRKPTDMPGYFLNPGDKAEAFGKYRKALKDGTFIQRSYEANKECLFYIQVVGGRAIEHTSASNSQDPTGARESHGDRCVADVMANYGLYVFRNENIVDTAPPMSEYCFAARRKRYENRMREREEVWA